MFDPGFPIQSGESVLFITLDSCRFDTFTQAKLPNMNAVGPVHKMQAPSHFTYGSHAAMFVGFTPGAASAKEAFLNPKFGKIFKLVGAGYEGKGREAYALSGKNIIEGFANKGFVTIGVGAMGWFNPGTPAGSMLTESFEDFFFSGPFYVKAQVDWLKKQISAHHAAGRTDQFVFMNIGETHVPYYHEGASWSAQDNPCQPFQKVDRADDCRHRQRRCAEYVDSHLKGLLESFSQSTVLICGDHGDCWGENGIWEHGVAHPMTLTVPLVAKIRGVPVKGSATRRFSVWR